MSYRFSLYSNYLMYRLYLIRAVFRLIACTVKICSLAEGGQFVSMLSRCFVFRLMFVSLCVALCPIGPILSRRFVFRQYLSRYFVFRQGG